MNIEKSIIVSVVTATYNRAYTLSRPFESLKRQKFTEFEWVVVDDGSTDDTEILINKFKKEASFPIVYYKKENAGKLSAVNVAYKLISGDYVILLDSDDELLDDCLENALKLWNQIPNSSKEKYWSVCGRCIANTNGKIEGKLFPEKMNLYGIRKQYKILQNINGDRFSCTKAEIIKKYPFPEPFGLKRVAESLVWDRINREYQQWYTNIPFARVYEGNDNLTKETPKQRAPMGYYSYCYKLNVIFDRNFFPLKQYLKTVVGVQYYGNFLEKSIMECVKDIKKLHNKILVFLAGSLRMIFNILSK